MPFTVHAKSRKTMHARPSHTPTPVKGNYIFITSSGKRYWGRSTSESVNLRAISARSTFSTVSTELVEFFFRRWCSSKRESGM